MNKLTDKEKIDAVDSLMKHTPGLWYANQYKLSCAYQIIRDRPDLNKIATEEMPFSRVVECVNACEGIENPIVLLEIRRLMARLDKCLELGINIEPKSSYARDIKAARVALGVK